MEDRDIDLDKKTKSTEIVSELIAKEVNYSDDEIIVPTDTDSGVSRLNPETELLTDSEIVSELITKELNCSDDEIIVPTDTDSGVSRLNPETELLTDSDPDEMKIRKSNEDKFGRNRHNKNQPF